MIAFSVMQGERVLDSELLDRGEGVLMFRDLLDKDLDVKFRVAMQ